MTSTPPFETQYLTANQALSWLLLYPEEAFHVAVGIAVQSLRETAPGILEIMEPGLIHFQTHSVEELQEGYCQTFDFSRDLTLELGWHLYGEDYHRGEWLSELNALRAQHHMPPSVELADHLAILLVLLDRLTPSERDIMLNARILKALRTLQANLDKDENNPYRSIVAGITHYLNTPALGTTEEYVS